MSKSLQLHNLARAAGRPRAVIGHPYIGRGGSESKVMWLIEALKQDWDLTVATTGGWNLAELNAFYGTSVREGEVKVRIAPVPFWARNRSAAALRGSCYQRFARRIAGEYDLRISAYNPTDWGLPAVHFIADFTWHQAIRERLDPKSPGFIYRDSILRKAYLGIAAAYASPSGRDTLREDVLIANSRWTRDLIRQECGVDCATMVYPTVWAKFPKVAWEDKEQAFVMIGRIAPEKQVERAIAILEAVRQRGHALRLHLCGHISSDPYGQQIAALCAQHADWIVAEGRVIGTKKAEILARCRYGIQTRGAEPFGITVAEMVKAGAIVFAPNDGGQTEILEHPDLLFGDIPDAVEKIQAVLENASTQTALRTHLAARAPLFSAENYVRDVRACIAAVGASHPDETSTTARQTA